ncbi:hypothetical protein HanIR_Chr02g0059661 [Helianthus annuus]|nr:hypothetical protein HanIR_Chr02g0059661 [Helianthus annuus]
MRYVLDQLCVMCDNELGFRRYWTMWLTIHVVCVLVKLNVDKSCKMHVNMNEHEYEHFMGMTT